MGRLSKEIRSYNMSCIRSKDTKPEILVRSFLFSEGFRYRKNVKDLPGCPDVVLPQYKSAIFINGCFWHVHEGCPKFVWPITNKEYWISKLKKNKEKDRLNQDKLREIGWNVIIVWECELSKKLINERLHKLIGEIKGTGIK